MGNITDNLFVTLNSEKHYCYYFQNMYVNAIPLISKHRFDQVYVITNGET